MKYNEKITAVREEKMQEIVASSYRIFLKKGIDNVTMESIAKENGIAPITMYRMFNDKKALLIKTGILFWQETYKLNNPSNTKRYKNANGHDQAVMLLSAFIPALLKYREHVKFLSEFDAYMVKNHVSQEELKEYDAAIAGWHETAHCAYQKGIDDGSIDADFDFEAYYYTATRMLLFYIQKVASTEQLLESDDCISEKKQIELAVKMMVSYLDLYNKNVHTL